MSIGYKVSDKTKYPSPVPYKLAHGAYLAAEKYHNTCELIGKINKSIVNAYKENKGFTNVCFDIKSVNIDDISNIFAMEGYKITLDYSTKYSNIPKYFFHISWED